MPHIKTKIEVTYFDDDIDQLFNNCGTALELEVHVDGGDRRIRMTRDISFNEILKDAKIEGAYSGHAADGVIKFGEQSNVIYVVFETEG